MALAASVVGAEEAWELPTNGFELLRHLQRESSDISTSADLKVHSDGVGARGFILGYFFHGFIHNRYCTPENGIEYADIILVVRAYLEQNTESLSLAAAPLTDAALAKAFPCK